MSSSCGSERLAIRGGMYRLREILQLTRPLIVGPWPDSDSRSAMRLSHPDPLFGSGLELGFRRAQGGVGTLGPTA